MTSIAGLTSAFFAAGALAALAFLVYSLLNLERLGIGPAHPRVMAEAVLVVVLALAAATPWRRQCQVQFAVRTEQCGGVAG